MNQRSRQARSPLFILWLLLFLTVFAAGSVIWLEIGPCSVGGRAISVTDLILTLSPILFGGLGTMIVYRDRRNAIGWVMVLAGAGFDVAQALNLYTKCLAGGVAMPAETTTPWLIYSLLPILGFPIALLIFLLPDGRFLSTTWRRVVLMGAAVILTTQLLLAFLPGELQYNIYGFAAPVENPAGIPWLPTALEPPAAWASWLTLSGLFLLGLAAFVLRFRRTEGDARQQLKWIAYFLVLAVTTQNAFELFGTLITPAFFETWIYRLSGVALFVGFPLVIGIAVFKYRLYDIDIIIKRTVVYGLLTAFLALIYFGSIIFLQRVFTMLTGHGSDLAIVISTLVIAVLFNPLRLRLQSWIDRRFYRRRYDAEQALRAFAVTARDEVDVAALEGELAGLIQQTIQPTHVSVWIQER